MAGPWEKYQGPWAKYAAQPVSDGGVTVVPKGGEPRNEDEAKEKPSVDAVPDVLKSGATGLLRGVAAVEGAPGDIRFALANAIEKYGGVSLPTIPGYVKATNPSLKTTADIMAPFEQAGMTHTPQTTAGEYAETIGEFAPGAALPGGIARRILLNVLLPAVGSETAGQATKGTPYEGVARLAGSLAGPLAMSSAARLVTPFPARAANVAAANVLRKEGVPLTAGQETGSKTLKYAESELGGEKTADIIEKQNEAFTRAASRRMGADDPVLDAKAMENAYRRTGGTIGEIARRNVLNADQQLAKDAYNVTGEYMRHVPVSQRAPVVEEYMREIQGLHGRVPGDVYQEMRSRIGADARKTSDRHVKEALYGLQEALDDAFERSVANPQDVKALKTARRQYRNYLVLEDAMATGGQETAAGVLTPARLEQAAASKLGRRAYLHGKTDFTDLAKAGKVALSKMPESGTSYRMAIRAAPSILGAGVGGGIGGSTEAMLGALGGAAAQPILGSALMSRPVQAYLRNQIAAGVPVTDALKRAALVDAMMAPRLMAPQPSAQQ